MHRINIIKLGIRRAAFTTVALLLFFTAPAPIYVHAEDAACNPAVSAPQGVQRPTGADGVTYVYNECTGLWENEHYTWNPTTKTKTAKTTAPYVYNEATEKWDSSQWLYSPASKSWYQSSFSVSEPPAGAETRGGPKPKTVSAEQPPATSEQSSTNSATTNANSGTGATDSTTNTSLNNANNSTVNNSINSEATSGDAIVRGNTYGGSASTGNAQAIANVMNLLQSSSTMTAPVATFVANIDGDIQGDLLIDPSFFQPTADVSQLQNDIDVNIANNGVINNDISLTAKTGDATVAENTNAGDAKTGNATAIANVVNMMNSMISANQSFLGVLNINGSLNGNILMPEHFYDQLIASNAPSETVAVSQNTINNLAANLSNTTSIENDVTSRATSGSANTSENTNAGASTTGAANTKVTIFNLTNHQVTAGNSMLVFVNVTGKWVGVIMDAPAGSTAAAFGGGIANNTLAKNTDITATSTGTIRNTIDVAAASGDASVSRNTRAGSATSGNANTAVNVANISNSALNLTGWFGILFINVFGSWNGNFGVATSLPPTGKADSASPSSAPAVFGFTPSPNSTGSQTPTGVVTPDTQSNKKVIRSAATSDSGQSGSGNIGENELARVASSVLGATSDQNQPKLKASAPTTATSTQDTVIVIGSIMVLIGIVFFAGTERRYRQVKR